MQPGCEPLGGDFVGRAVFFFKHQAPFVATELKPRRVRCADAVAAVAVEVQDVVVARPFLEEMAPELVESRRAQHPDGHRQLFPPDQFDQRTRDGAVVHVLIERARRDEQDADAIARQFAERRRFAHVLTEPALNAGAVAEVAEFGKVERFPRPREVTRIVAGDRHVEHGVRVLRNPRAGVEIVEECFERRRAPRFQRRLNAFRPHGVRLERITEERLQIPAELRHERLVARIRHRPHVRRRDLGLLGGLVGIAIAHEEPGRFAAGDLRDAETSHTRLSPLD